MNDYDVAVIGGGSAGLVACKLAAGLDRKTVLIEKKKLGGDCTWFGCVPSKALIKAADVAWEAGRLGEYGLSGGGAVNGDGVMEHVRKVREDDAAGLSVESFQEAGVDVVFGDGEFVGRRKFKVDEKVIKAKKFIICTGSSPAVGHIEGLEEIGYLTNETVFELDKLPGSILILGGGPIGCEMACAMNRLGVKVTVIQRSAILKRDDDELVGRLVETMRADGVEVLDHANLLKVYKDGDEVAADVEVDNQMRQVRGEAVLVAMGRRANVDGLGLEAAGVEYDQRGIKVNKCLRTTAKNIYAAGDVIGGYLFTHVAEYEAVIAGSNAALGIFRRAKYDNVLWCTFTRPELASSGMTEQQAREAHGDNMRVYRWEHGDVDRCKTDLETVGLTKVICNLRGKILGVHILGHGACEILHEVQLARKLGKSFGEIGKMMHAYPSYSDAVRQPGKLCYVDMLRDSRLVKMAQYVMAPKNRRRMVSLGIFVVLLLVLGLLFGNKLSLENIQSNADKVLAFSNSHYGWSILVFVVTYIVVAGFGLPVATGLTLMAGFLYGTIRGAVYVNVGATAGAVAAFLFARFIAGASIQAKYGDRLKGFNNELEKNGAGYMLSLRLIPAVPFFLLNLLAGLTKLKLQTFAWTTSLGIIPGSLVFAYAGRQLGSVDSADDILSPGMNVALVLLGVLAIGPIVYKKVKARRGREAA